VSTTGDHFSPGRPYDVVIEVRDTYALLCIESVCRLVDDSEGARAAVREEICGIVCQVPSSLVYFIAGSARLLVR
jgi:hypothetical protein